MLIGLVIASATSIFAHATAHHFFGLPSTLGFSRYYPKVKAKENEDLALRGSLAGPLFNLILGYLCFHAYRERPLSLFLYFGSANLFFTAVSCTVNCIVPRKPRNDLRTVSKILGVPAFVLPCIAVSLAVPPLWAIWSFPPFSSISNYKLIALSLLALVAAYLLVLAIDMITGVRMTLVRKHI